MEEPLKRGLNLFLLKKYRASEQELRKALAAYSQIAQVHSLLAFCLSAQGRTKDALREAKGDITSHPRVVENSGMTVTSARDVGRSQQRHQ